MTTDEAQERSFGERVRAARIHRRMSLATLASELGLTYQQIRKYEIGQSRISATMLFEVARVLDVDLAYFFAGNPDATGDATATSSLDFDLLAAIRRIDDEESRRRITALVETVESLDRRK